MEDKSLIFSIKQEDICIKREQTENVSQSDVFVGSNIENLNEIKHLCVYCIFVTNSAENLRNHELSKHSICERVKFFRCIHKNCSYGTNKLNLIKTHLNEHVATQFDFDVVEEELLHCSKCSFETDTSGRLFSHEFHQHGLPNHILCLNLDLKTNSGTSLKRQIIIKPSPLLKDCPLLDCPCCDEYKTTSKDCLRHHLSGKHSKLNTVYKCDDCSFQTKHKKYLSVHHNLMHNTEKLMLKCPHCDDYKTPTMYGLRRHIRRKHPEKGFKCDICPFKTKYAYVLQRHQKVHKCPQSNDCETSKKALKQHLNKKHLNGTHKCDKRNKI